MPGVSTVDDGSVFTLPGLSAGALNADLVSQIYVGQYGSIVVNIGSGVYSGVLTAQGTNDPTDSSSWQTLKMTDMISLDAGDTSSAGFNSVLNRVFGCIRTYAWFRVRMTSYTSGSASGVLQLYRNGLPGLQLQYVYTRAQYGHLVRTNAGTVLTSGAVSSNSNSADFQNLNARGVKLFISTGSFGAGASNITVSLQGRDPQSGTYYDILDSVALSASSFTTLTIYPGLPYVPNVSVNDILPTLWRATWQASAWGTGGSTLGISSSLSE